jgi:tricarboxylate carrier
MKRSFSLNDSRYDQSSFGGRFRHFVEFTNPFLLLTSAAEMEEMKIHLTQFKNNTLPDSVSDEKLWKAKYVIGGTFAKDGEMIPWPFRMSGYAVGNLPICVGLMLPGAGLATTVLFQWANQTQNALTNHFNRPSVEALPMDKLGVSYGGAVVAAVGISVGAKQAVSRVANAAVRANLGRIVPFMSVASANVVNTYLMRRHEIAAGIKVFNTEGNEVGTSQIAAAGAVKATCASRAVLSFCMLFFPPFIYPVFERTALLKANPRLNLPMQFMVCSFNCS